MCSCLRRCFQITTGIEDKGGKVQTGAKEDMYRRVVGELGSFQDLMQFDNERQLESVYRIRLFYR